MNNSPYNSDLNESIHPSKWKFWKHRRYIVAIMGFFGYFNVYALRSNLSIAVVAMTSDRYEALENGTHINIGPEFNWTNAIQGYILSSFFYGYITTQLIGGFFAAKYGGNIIYGTGIAVTALFTTITPWLVTANVYLLIAVGIIEGVFEGVTYPSMLAVWAKWAPPLERSHLSMIACSGSYFGTVVAMPLSALLADAFGWRSIFFFFGVLGLIWYTCWTLMVASSPDQDSKISQWELDYIKASLDLSPNEEGNKLSVPWKSILSSKAVWALCVASFAENWGFYTFLTLLPKYLKDIYKFNLGASGFLSALPYLFMGIIMPFAGKLADLVISRGYLTVQRTRKSFNVFGYLSQFCFIMVVAFAPNQYIVVFSLSMAVGLGAFAYVGILVNPLDIAPQYASILLGITNTFATVPGIISPIIAGYIVSDNPTISEWQVVFFISAGIYLFGAIFYATFASGEVQFWAKRENENIVKRNIDFET